MSIDEFYDFGHNSFELRFMSISTHINGNNTKWDGKMAFRHGGPHQSSWWISSRMIKRSLQVDFELSDTKNYDFAIYVKINNPNMLLHRNNFLRYMGGQSHVFLFMSQSSSYHFECQRK